VNYDPAEPDEIPDGSPELSGDTDTGAQSVDERRDLTGPHEPTSALPPKLEAWRRRSATGAILTGLALGFQQALEAPREQATISIETSGTPPRDLPVDAEVEVLRPRHSVVSIRPWLLDAADKNEAREATAQPRSEATDAGSDQPQP
jgi:hypothetical protein